MLCFIAHISLSHGVQKPLLQKWWWLWSNRLKTKTTNYLQTLFNQVWLTQTMMLICFTTVLLSLSILNVFNGLIAVCWILNGVALKSKMCILQLWLLRFSKTKDFLPDSISHHQGPWMSNFTIKESLECACTRVHVSVCLFHTVPNPLNSEAWKPGCDRTCFLGQLIETGA